MTMVELKCTNCGGRLATADDDILMSGITAVVRHGTALRCHHCGAEYVPGEQLALFAGIDVDAHLGVDVHQQIGTVESGGTVIGAQISLGKSNEA